MEYQQRKGRSKMRKQRKVWRKKQGRIHGHQLRTGGQGRKCNCPQIRMFYNACFPTFRLVLTDGRMDGRTDGPTDKASNRVACPQLKTSDDLKQTKPQPITPVKKGIAPKWNKPCVDQVTRVSTARRCFLAKWKKLV